MSRVLLLAAALACFQIAFDAVAAAETAGPIVVEVDRATLIKLPVGRRRTLVLDDPLIARATYLAASNQVVITGISYGQTRMSMLGETGDVIATSVILVREPVHAGVTVYRGTERGTYFDCARQCQPGLRLGDGKLADIAGQGLSIDGSVTTQPRLESGGHL